MHRGGSKANGHDPLPVKTHGLEILDARGHAYVSVCARSDAFSTSYQYCLLVCACFEQALYYDCKGACISVRVRVACVQRGGGRVGAVVGGGDASRTYVTDHH